MAPQSSQTSSAASPSLKRKQQSISSFFTPKTSSTQRSPSNESETIQTTRPRKTTASPPERRKESIQEQVEDEEDDEIVAPVPKRPRTNGSAEENSRASTSVHVDKAQPSSSQRTDLSKFQSYPAFAATIAEEEDVEHAQRKKEKEKLHQKFVRKLGGPDCLVGIGRSTINDVTATEEGAEGDEDEEPIPLPATKGRGAAKKGGSKLTPMEKQVVEIKRKHMDTVLVIEVGYKFRFFGEDARVAAKELGIVCIPGKFRFDERECSILACRLAEP